MLRNTSKLICAAAICAVIGFAASAAHAATIIKLNLGGIGPDIELDGAGILSTFNDGDGTTTGDQNTAIEFTDFLNGNPDVNTSTGSVTIDGLALNGPAFVSPPIVTQSFLGGTISLYDPAPGNNLLLQGQLGASTLVGTLGPPGSGVVFTTTFANVTGGSLDPLIADNTLTLQMTLSNINGGAGLSVGGAGPFVNPFLADAAVTMDADPIPEPTTASMLLVLGSALAAAASKRRR